MMTPKIEALAPKKLVGMSTRMSFADDKTAALWKNFRPRQRDIKNGLHEKLFSVQVYDARFDFNQTDPSAVFERWAAVEVPDFSDTPKGMTEKYLEGGLYAVFSHKGPAQTFSETWKYIFYDWLPKSEWELDQRAHFELLDNHYNPNDPDAEEEIFIPIREKRNA